MTKKKISEARVVYKPIGIYASNLFFAVMTMGKIHIMYQYSLGWFIQLYLDVKKKK